jgi:protocatechuate 3,4-dioxygenase beta subunit
MDRRKFIFGSGAGMIALTLVGKSNYVFGAEEELTDRGACLPTTSDILGPFYRANAPLRSVIAPAGAAGTALNFKGQVYDEDCNPIPGALVDVWHADNVGGYDNTSADFNYRGKYQVNSSGEYIFESVKPGWYLNGSQYRPSHIHFRVTAPGYIELITQLYFENDPYIPNDPWASDEDAEFRIVPITQIGGVDTAVFNIYLKSTTSGIKKDKPGLKINIANNPFDESLIIDSPDQPINNVELFSNKGKLVASKYDVSDKRITLDTRALSGGTYFVRISAGKEIVVHQVVKAASAYKY